MAPDTTTFEATWKADTLVLDASAVGAHLRNPNATDGVYQLNPNAPQIASLTVGQVLVLTGVDLVKVESIDVQPDVIIVKTTPASLIDAATDANVAWDIGADVSRAAKAGAKASGGILPQTDPVISCKDLDKAGPCETFTGKLGNLDATESIVFGADGSIKTKATLAYNAGKGVMSVAGTATLQAFRHRGSAVIEHGTLKSATVSLENVDLDLDLNVGAVAMGASDDLFKFPVAVTFPFPLGPIPAYLKLSISIAVNPSLTDSSSARSHLHYHVGGSMGFQVTGATIIATGAFKSIGGADPMAKDTETVSVVDAGFGVVFESPRVAFGVGIAELASVEAYLVAREEVTINEVMKYDPHGFIVGNCATVGANVGAYAGGDLRLAGLKFNQEKQLAGIVREVYKNGNPSMAVCK